jgi:hypothetical protein
MARAASWRGNATIVVDPGGSGALAVHRYRVTDRLLARVLSRWLDGRLAAGEAPEASRLLAARARVIVPAPWRARLASDWEHLVDVAGRPAALPARGVPLRRAAVIAAEPAIRDLASRLRVPLPVSARGVAAASALLTDGMGPLYNSQAPVTLADAVQEAIGWLDPTLPLMVA